jgi:hypothetical protein
MPVVVGDAAHVGVILRTTRGSTALRSVDVGPSNENVEITSGFTATGPGEDGIGSYRGDLTRYGIELSPLHGARIDNRTPDEGSFWVVLTFVPSRSGVFRFDDVTVRYGSGLRRFAQALDYDICIVAVQDEAEMLHAAGRCEDDPIGT